MKIITLLILSFVIRVFGALVDGYGGRVPESDSNIWHVLNWMRRDVVILVMYISASIQYLKKIRFDARREDKRFDIGTAWFIAIIANYLLHNIFYAIGVSIR